MYIGHDRLCVCLSVPCMHPDVTLRNGRECPLVVHHWVNLQLVHRFHYYDNICLCIQHYRPTLQCKRISVDVNSIWTTPSQSSLLKPDRNHNPNSDPILTTLSQVQWSLTITSQYLRLCIHTWLQGWHGGLTWSYKTNELQKLHRARNVSECLLAGLFCGKLVSYFVSRHGANT